MSSRLEYLIAERDKAVKQVMQCQHRLQRYENRDKYYDKGQRAKRTHRLCNIGGTIESLAPEVKELSQVETYELMEQIFTMPEVQAAVKKAARKEDT